MGLFLSSGHSGLSDEEITFYDALAESASACEAMGDSYSRRISAIFTNAT
jgi:hypothetical protein